MKFKERLRNGHRSVEMKGMWELSTRWYHGLDPDAEMWQWGHWWEPNKVCHLVSRNVNFFVLKCALGLCTMPPSPPVFLLALTGTESSPGKKATEVWAMGSGGGGKWVREWFLVPSDQSTGTVQASELWQQRGLAQTWSCRQQSESESVSRSVSSHSLGPYGL